MPSEKLVRDRIPDIIRRNGDQPVVRRARPEELDLLLREKIVEEAQELLASGANEEIADILEALYALLEHRGVTRAEVETLRLNKERARGGFREGYVLEMPDESEI